MLKGISHILGPDLLRILQAMGHGDELAIVDANFPAETNAQQLVRMDGHSATTVLEAVLSVLPLDNYVDSPIQTMQVVDAPSAVPSIVEEFHSIVRHSAPRVTKYGTLERFAFYERAKHSFAIVATGETRLYGNILIKKGVIDPDE